MTNGIDFSVSFFIEESITQSIAIITIDIKRP